MFKKSFKKHARSVVEDLLLFVGLLFVFVLALKVIMWAVKIIVGIVFGFITSAVLFFLVLILIYGLYQLVKPEKVDEELAGGKGTIRR